MTLAQLHALYPTQAPAPAPDPDDPLAHSILRGMGTPGNASDLVAFATGHVPR